jgi:formyltetrahydrofolate hydrolase
MGAAARYGRRELDEVRSSNRTSSALATGTGPKSLPGSAATVERVFLDRGEHWHLDDRILVHRNRLVSYST